MPLSTIAACGGMLVPVVIQTALVASVPLLNGEPVDGYSYGYERALTMRARLLQRRTVCALSLKTWNSRQRLTLPW